MHAEGARAAHGGRYRWVLMALYLAVTGGSLLVMFSVGVMLPDMTQDLRLSTAQQGMIGAVAWFGAMIFFVPLTALLSRYPPVRVTTAVTALGIALTGLQAWAPNFEIEMLGRFLFVITWIAQGPARTLLIQQWFKDDEVAVVNGLTMAALGFTEVAAIWGTPLLIEQLGGWRQALLAYGLISSISLVAWLAIAREHGGSFMREMRASQSSMQALRASLGRGAVWWLIVIGIGSAISWSAFFTFWPTFAVDSRGLDLDLAGFIWGLGGVALALTAFVAGPVSARIRRRRPLIWLPNLLSIPFFLALLSTDNVALLAAYSTLLGCCWIALPIIQTVPFELPRIEPREVPMVVALTMVAQNAGTMLGPLFVGTLGEFTDGLGVPLAIAVVFELLTVFGALMLPETSPRRARVAAAPGHQTQGAASR